MAEKTPAPHLFMDLSRSLCPECRRLVDAQVIARYILLTGRRPLS
jgi:uncharacterized radical SAM superfamily Fe-S cluster-containing enzyme